MHVRCRPLVRCDWLPVLVLAGFPLLPIALASADEISDLRRIAQEAAQVLDELYGQVRYLQTYGSGGGFGSMGQVSLMDVDRTARRAEDLGRKAASVTSKCEKDVRKVTRDFSSQTRRIASLVNRMLTSRDPNDNRMTLDQVEFALRRAQGAAAALGQIMVCVPEQQPEGEGGAADVPPEAPKQPPPEPQDDY